MNDVLSIPRVIWGSFMGRHPIRNHRAVMRNVKQLVNEVWHRIPRVARAVIRRDLRLILLSTVPTWTGSNHESGIIALNVSDYEGSPEWYRRTVAAMAHAFAYSFTFALATAIAGGNLRTGDVAASRLGKPRAEWWEGFYGGGPADEARDEFIERLAEAVMLAWGFGEEWAETQDLNVISRPDDWESSYLDVEVGKVFRILRRRLGWD
jgi:hypothetical protein